MAQPESRLSKKIMKAWRKRGVWCWKVHGSEYQPAGIPDITGIFQGYSIWCETKMPGNKTSPKQEYQIRKIRSAGGFAVVAYSLTDALAMINHLEKEHTDNCDCLYSVPR